MSVDELLSKKPRTNTPERMCRISQTQLSVARHFGGCRFNGAHYVYDPTTDTLIREDVLRREQKEARAMRSRERRDRSEAAPGAGMPRQGSLFGEDAASREGQSQQGGSAVGGLMGDALVSECGLYRYWLTRTWDQSRPPACFVMLNPSTADAERDDPTIRRCVGFARAWDWGGLAVVNLFAFRATSPTDLKRARAPVGPDNDRHLLDFAGRAGVVVAAWGTHGAYLRRGREVVALLRGAGVALRCLGTTADGSPRHPLYVRADRTLTDFLGESQSD